MRSNINMLVDDCGLVRESEPSPSFRAFLGVVLEALKLFIGVLPVNHHVNLHMAPVC